MKTKLLFQQQFWAPLHMIGLFQKLDAHPSKEDMEIPKILITFFIEK